MTFKISKRSYLELIIAIYLIWPLYCYIGSINGANIILLLFLISWLVINKIEIKRISFKSFFTDIVLFWIISRVIVYLYHGEITRAIIFLLSTVALGIVTVDCIRDRVSFWTLLDVLIKVGFIVCCFGIIEAVTGINIFSYLNNSNTILNYNAVRMGRIRILSFTGQTINYCLFCGMLALLTFYRINTSELSKKKQRFYIFTYFLLIINMLLTLSRSSIFVFMIAQLLMIKKLGFKKLVKYILIVFLIVILGTLLYNIIFAGENMLLQIIYMLLAVFDDRFSRKIVGWSSEQDASGVADRFVLYVWVWKSIKNHLIFGMGEKKGFLYNVNRTDGLSFWIFKKTSIEVNHLSLIYHYGLVSTIGEILVYGFGGLKAFLQAQISSSAWENKLNFNYTFSLIVLMDLLSWFAVNAGSEEKLIHILFFCWIAYNKNVI